MFVTWIGNMEKENEKIKEQEYQFRHIALLQIKSPETYITFAEKKYDVVILSYYIFDFSC